MIACGVEEAELKLRLIYGLEESEFSTDSDSDSSKDNNHTNKMLICGCVILSHSFSVLHNRKNLRIS